MNNYVEEIYRIERQQETLQKTAVSAWQFENLHPTRLMWMHRLGEWVALLNRVSKIRIEVAVVVQEPRLDNAGC